MVVFKYVHQKPRDFTYIKGDRTWGEMKEELEAKYFTKKKQVDETQQQSQYKKRREDDNSSFLVAYLQHDVDNDIYRLVHVDEIILETYSLIIQRLPKKFALANAEVRLANRFITKPENYGKKRPEKRLRENATEDERIDFILEQSYVDIQPNYEKKQKIVGDEKELSKKFNRKSFAIHCPSADSAKIVESDRSDGNFVQMNDKKEQKFKRPTGIPKKFLTEIPYEEAIVLVTTEPNIYHEGSKYFRMKDGTNTFAF